MNIIYDTKHLKIEHDSSFGGLYIKWIGYTDSATFKAGVDTVLEAMKTHKAKKTLSDIREHRGISPQDQEYASQLSIKFDKENWQVIRALTVPEDVFARFALRNVNQKVEEAGQFRKVFDSLEEARQWLIDHKV